MFRRSVHNPLLLVVASLTCIIAKMVGSLYEFGATAFFPDDCIKVRCFQENKTQSSHQRNNVHRIFSNTCPVAYFGLDGKYALNCNRLLVYAGSLVPLLVYAGTLVPLLKKYSLLCGISSSLVSLEDDGNVLS